MAQRAENSNQCIASDVIQLTNIATPVITIQGSKLVSHRIVAALFQLSDELVAETLIAAQSQPGCKHDVYVDADDIYCSSVALGMLEKPYPEDVDFTGLSYLLSLLDNPGGEA